MKFISTKVHGILDYVYALLLFIVPRFYHLVPDSAAIHTLHIAALAVLLYSLFTRYELGVFKKIPMRYHLFLDVILGVSLAVSPWLLGFSDYAAIYLFFGIFAIVVVLFSATSSANSKENTFKPGK